MPAARRGAITGASSESAFAQAAASSFSPAPSSMSFFGAPTPAPGTPAPAPTFGAPAPAPTFGAPAPAPAFGAPSPDPAFGAPAPATAFGAPSPAPASSSLFGTPAPAPGGFSFGSPAPAPSGGLFGTPAPATSNSLFGAPAPAPGSSLFGTPTPAPGGSLFGAPAPAPGTTSLFGTPSPAYGAPAAVVPPTGISGDMLYSALPPDQKQAIDQIYQAMIQHKRTILQVSTMAPKLLETSKHAQQADVAAGAEHQPLKVSIHQLATKATQLQQQLEAVRRSAEYTKDRCEMSTKQAYMYAKWPTEAVAMRRGVALTKLDLSAEPASSDKDLQRRLKDLLDREMVHVDRVEQMPSPYLWQLIDEMEGKLRSLKSEVDAFHLALQQSKQKPQEEISIAEVVQRQEQSIWRVAAQLARVHAQVDQIRQQYKLQEKGTNVLEMAEEEERRHQEDLTRKLRMQMIKNLKQAAPTPAPAGGLFGAPAPSSSGGLFGAPAPSSGGLFGSSPAPAPGGGLFGSTPAPVSGAGLFGNAPAPAPAGGLFGSTPAPAPGSGLFGNTPAPAPAGGLFGTPAPAPGGGLLASTPGPAPSFGGFSSTSTSSTPRSKNKSRSTRRK